VSFDRAKLADLYPFQSHWFDRCGLRYHYLDEGAGEPVLCVHGNPTWSFHFRRVVLALRSTHRVIVPDHIGCGLSDKPGDDRYEYTLASRVEDLEALIAALDLTDITLIVHDWGGMIGIAAALRNPPRFARIIVLNTAAFLPPAGKRLPRRLAIVRNNRRLAAILVRGFNAFARGAARMATRRGLPADVRAAYLAPYDSWANRIATLRFVQDIPQRPGDRSFALSQWVDDHLHRLRGMPMLICWGQRDFVFDSAYLAEWRRRFPAAEVHTFRDAGHYLLEDEPDAVTARIRDFLRETQRTASAARSEESAR
jgi:haloalkane dehalogenase